MATTVDSTQKKISQDLLVAAVKDMQTRQLAIQAEQLALLERNKIAKESLADISGEALVQKFKANVSEDLESITKFNDAIKRYPNPKKIPFAVRFNKMTLIIEGTRDDIFAIDDNIVNLSEGKLPSGYSNEITEFPKLSSGQFWGTSKSTFLSYSLLAMNFTINGASIKEIPLPLTVLAIIIRGLLLPSGKESKTLTMALKS